tara:strand:+ start:1392 stop:5396 length:4005 start_codon:yes stop_codon:yes gene_type:complete
MDEFGLEDLSYDEIQNRLNDLQNNTGELDSELSTDIPIQSDSSVTPEGVNKFEGMTLKEKVNAAEPGELIPGVGRMPREGVGGFVTDVAQSTGESLAPAVGVLDTITDVVNMVTPKGIPNIPKIPDYEAKSVQAVRNISGLAIPSLGLRSLAIQGASKIHAAGQAAPWLQTLGNSKSFSYFAKFGIDVGTGGFVDYAAEQNQKDDNLLGTLKAYWPKTFQWIPESIATNADDTAGEKRSKNVLEGAVFNVLSSIIEGAAYLTKAGKSIKKTSQFIPIKEGGNKNIDTLTKDEFTDIQFSDNPIEDNVLRGYARKEKELNLLNEYYVSRGEAPVDSNLYDEGELLVRTKDPDGILGAAADAAQIQNNLDSSWGRIGNIIHEATRKEGIELENLSKRTLVSELTQQLKEGGPYSKRLRSNKLISAKMMDDAGKKLAATLLHPRVSPDEIIGLLDEFKRSVEGSAVRIVGKKGISKAIKQLQTQMLDLDTQKARAYLATSEAGQVADFSEGARYMEGGASVNRTIDLMADRLEVLMVEKGLANFEVGSMISNMNAWKKAVETGDKEIINSAADTILDSQSAKLTEIIPNVKEWTSTIKAVARENPEFLRPLLLANEFTDGNVDTLWKLHNWAAENLATFKKAIYDGNPEVPSIVNKAMWSNIFNSALSALATPVNAGVGNLTGLMGRGLATVTGAVVQGDLARAKRAMVAHFALDDTLQKATDHMRLVFRKASNNPTEVSYMMRGDIARHEEQGLDILRSWAYAASENGEDGGLMMLSVFEDLDALSKDPVLRFGGNAMTALDGFSKSVVANTEAKYTAFNKLAQSGEEITEESFKKAVNEVYESWFDGNDMLKNEAVDKITQEIALNADSPVVEGMNNFIKRFPAARTFIWFPRTTANVIDTFGKWSPAGILSADYQKMWGPLGMKKIDQFSMDEITEILQSKGKPVDEFAMETFEMLRAEIKGKAALGSLMVTMAGFAAVGDRCTGNGHYDKAVQRQRVRSGWKPKSCKVPGTDKQVSYEWMGPIGDWLSLTIDVVDNFDSLSTAMQEDLYNKLTFVLGAAITNRSVLSQLEPMYDVLQGNGAAASRFLTSFGNNLVPLGSLRNELGKIMYPQLRQIRSELDQNLRNRNAWLDAFDPERALPSVVDPIDGQEIGKEDNWFLRVWNRGPMKVTSKPSKERQFLIDIEFNSNPMMRTSQRGVVLQNHEITAINTVMGEQGIYKKRINEIMQRANRLTYTSPDGTIYKGFQNIIQAQRRGFIPSDVLDSGKYADIFSDLKTAYAQCKRLAEDSLPEPILSGIRDREYEKKMNTLDQRSGNLNQLYEDAGLQKTLDIAK